MNLKTILLITIIKNFIKTTTKDVAFVTHKKFVVILVITMTAPMKKRNVIATTILMTKNIVANKTIITTSKTKKNVAIKIKHIVFVDYLIAKKMVAYSYLYIH